MKKITTSIASIILIVNLGYAQCEKLFDFKEGTSWKWVNYDKKGKLLSKTFQQVEKFTRAGDGFAATLSVVQTDKDGAQGPKITMDMTCKDGVLYYDMKKFIPDEYLKDADGGTTVAIEGKNLELPIDMQPGDVLPDASVTMRLGSADSPMGFKMTVDIFNRKVEGQENLHTPAGQFDCLIIRQTIKTKAVVTFQMTSREWYQPDVGMVKSESYNKKGKLTGYAILTEFRK